MLHEERLTQANEAVLKARKFLNKEYYPTYHIAPYAGWMCNPTGLIYFKGLYHVFYIHNPFSALGGPMHWGHLSSEDLLHWRHHPISLAPGDDWDRDGCLPGCAVVHDDKLYIFYTGHHWLSDEMDDEQIYQVQCIAVSEDGFNFEKKGIILKPPANFTRFCAPKVWFDADRWWLLCGGRDHQDQGQLLLYSTDDIEDWDDSVFIVMAKTDDRNVIMWESPDFFHLANRHVLLYSQRGSWPHESGRCRRYQSGGTIGAWKADQAFTGLVRFNQLDIGHDFYAAQTLKSPDGRRIMIGWLGVRESNIPTESHNWSGLFTIPREITMDERSGKLRTRPIKELECLRKDYQRITTQQISSNANLIILEDSSACEIKAIWNTESTNAEKYGFWIGSGCELYVDSHTRKFVVNRHYPAYTISGYRSCDLPEKPLLHLDIFVDHSCVEVFVNDGEFVFSSRIYPSTSDRSLRIFSIDGAADLPLCEMWNLELAVMQ